MYAVMKHEVLLELLRSGQGDRALWVWVTGSCPPRQGEAGGGVHVCGAKVQQALSVPPISIPPHILPPPPRKNTLPCLT